MKKFIPLALLAFLIGCDTHTKFTGGATHTRNNVGQTIESVGYSDLTNWVENHKDCKIVTITSCDRGNEGATSEYLIVYEESSQR